MRLISGFFALVLLLIIISLFLPSQFEVESSILINADEEVIFDQLNDLRNWENWDPFIKSDSTITSEYSDPSYGMGAKSTWISDNSGGGTLVITGSVKNKTVRTQLFMKNEFGESILFEEKTLELVSAGTRVTSRMQSDLGWSPLNKYGSLLIKKRVLEDYKKGLQNLKDYCENNW